MPLLQSPINLAPARNRFLLIVLVFTASRLLNLTFFVATDLHLDIPHPDLGERLQSYFFKWDSGYYEEIAAKGYEPTANEMGEGRTRHAFYPLLPLLTRGFARISGLSLGTAGILLSHACFFGALWLFVAYCRTRADDATAVRALVLIALVPENFIFSAFYTESLYLLLVLAAWVSFDRRRTARACASAALLTATRSNGLFIIVYFGYEALRQGRRMLSEKRSWKEICRAAPPYVLPIIFTPLGLFAFWWFCYLTTGDAFAQKSAAYHGWSAYLEIPFSPLIKGFFHGPKDAFWFSAGLFFLISSLLLLRYRLFGDFLFVAVNLLFYFSNSAPESLLRYCIVLFPVYLGLSMLTRTRPFVFVALLLLFIPINAFLCYAWIADLHIAI